MNFVEITSLGVFGLVMALAGLVARYWARETVPQIIKTVALMWLFLLVMDLIRFWRWRHKDAASGSAGRVR
jgi:hypothetical protein